MRNNIVFLVCFCCCLYYSVSSFSQKRMRLDEPDFLSKIGVSLHGGFQKMIADVDGSGYGYGFKIKSPVSAEFDVAVNYFTATSKGLSFLPQQRSLFASVPTNAEYWFPSYKFRNTNLEFEAQVNLFSVMAKRFNVDIRNKFDVYLLAAAGIFEHKTMIDALDANNAPYEDLKARINFSNEKTATSAGRAEIKNALSEIYDGVYEGNGPVAVRNKVFSFGFGSKYALSKAINFGFEYRNINFIDYDYADGIRFLNSTDLNRSNDKAHFFSFFIEKSLNNK